MSGITCPKCGTDQHKVVDSRASGDFIRRRRKCLDAECGSRFSTNERVTGHPSASEADAFAADLEHFAEICRRNPRVMTLVEAYRRGEVLILDAQGDIPHFGG